MTTRIDFYLMPSAEEMKRLDFLCRLIEKIYKQNHRVYIHTETVLQAHELDERLWTFREESFLPHNLYGEGPDTAPPIQIGFNQAPEKQRDVLINFSHNVPSFYQQFSRVLELVTTDAEVQRMSREHYRIYRTAGHPIHTHKIQSIEA